MPMLLIGSDEEGGRLIALALPGNKVLPLFRLTSLGAYMTALALTQPLCREPGEFIPVELIAKEGFICTDTILTS